MKPSAIFVIALLLTACGVARPVLERDNTKVEVRTVVERVVDTAWVELPVIVERVVTLDTVSVLENKYAKSEAVVSAGRLSHSLATKAVREPVKVEKEIVYRDSLVYRDQVVREEVQVERKLNWWQSLKMKTGGVCLIAILLIIVYFVIKLLFNLNFLKV